jgi:hypothetical protein
MEKQSAISSQQSKKTIGEHSAIEQYILFGIRSMGKQALADHAALVARVGALHDAYHKLWTKHGDLAEPTVSEVEAAALAQAEVRA